MTGMTASADLVPDPVDEELVRLLAHPTVRERLDDFEDRLHSGRIERIPHADVRRHLGLPTEAPDPLPPGS